MKTASIVASVSRKAGGLFESVRRLHQSLAAIPDVEVTALGMEDEYSGEDIASWVPLPVETFRVLGPAKFGYAPLLKRRLMSLDVEVLHNHGLWMYPSVVTSAWHMAVRRPYMISPHGMLDPWALRNSAWKKRIARVLFEDDHLREAACIRALCQSEADSIRALGLRNPICVIPNGIDLPKLGIAECGLRRPPWEERIEAGQKVLLYLGRVHPKKGLVNLLQAWAEVQRSGIRDQRSEEWALAIAGWDQHGHENELKRLATDLGIRWTDVRNQKSEKSQLSTLNPQPASEASVVFLGPQFGDAKAACYAGCGAFILPSFSEGLPMVILEAWAYGKPVLMTPECNLPEGFARSAALQIGTDVESITAGLRELLGAPASSRQAMGRAGRCLVAQRFTWPKIASEMKAVYDWLVGGGTRPDRVVTN